MTVNYNLGGNKVILIFEMEPTTAHMDILEQYLKIMRETTLPMEER